MKARDYDFDDVCIPERRIAVSRSMNHAFIQRNMLKLHLRSSHQVVKSQGSLESAMYFKKVPFLQAN